MTAIEQRICPDDFAEILLFGAPTAISHQK
jgi:hypothetical protein